MIIPRTHRPDITNLRKFANDVDFFSQILPNRIIWDFCIASCSVTFHVRELFLVDSIDLKSLRRYMIRTESCLVDESNLRCLFVPIRMKCLLTSRSLIGVVEYPVHKTILFIRLWTTFLWRILTYSQGLSIVLYDYSTGDIQVACYVKFDNCTYASA